MTARHHQVPPRWCLSFGHAAGFATDRVAFCFTGGGSNEGSRQQRGAGLFTIGAKVSVPTGEARFRSETAYPGVNFPHRDILRCTERFVRVFLDAELRDVFPRGRLTRGYRHMFPLPSVGGPCKRLHLFLRWMVRREPPDFGLWTEVSPRRLLMPVDTHVENMSRAIGLTRRKSRNWKMAEEITASLAAIDPGDPVKYDFALCHKRMSGDCLDRRDAVVCEPCGLRAVCRHWRGKRRG